jgi:hypothetical protein
MAKIITGKAAQRASTDAVRLPMRLVTAVQSIQETSCEGVSSRNVSMGANLLPVGPASTIAAIVCAARQEGR